jgi:hypothetical protein
MMTAEGGANAKEAVQPADRKIGNSRNAYANEMPSYNEFDSKPGIFFNSP